MGSFEWKEVRKWTGVLISLPLSVLCGFDLAFTVYAVPLKEYFNYTQTQGTVAFYSAFVLTILNGYLRILPRALVLNQFRDPWYLLYT